MNEKKDGKDENEKATAVFLLCGLFSALAFISSYCYGIIYEQDHLLARSVLWATGTFVLVLFVLAVTTNTPDDTTDNTDDKE